MAKLTHFSYRPADTLLHRMDVRFKLLLMVVVGLTGLRIHFLPLVPLTILALVSISRIRIPPLAIVYELRYIGLLLLTVFVARATATPGKTVFNLYFLSVTQEGLYSGGLIAWRILLIVLLGIIFVATTRTSQIRGAIEWVFKPVPLIPEKRVATMIGLMLRFIPVILHQAKETTAALKSRGIENRKNPIYRLKKLALPLFRNILLTGENLTDAMRARCYSENRTPPAHHSGRLEWISLTLVLCLCLFLNLI